jgi:hypothetical protein
MIPPFRPDGYLPEGVHVCTEAEAIFYFGRGNQRRRRLCARLRRWIKLGRQVGARRLLVDGSFVTTKKRPDDVDAVLLVSPDFEHLVQGEDEAALELEEMFVTRQPQEIFAAEDEADWQDWVEFFSRTREADGRRKGIVEIQL